MQQTSCSRLRQASRGTVTRCDREHCPCRRPPCQTNRRMDNVTPALRTARHEAFGTDSEGYRNLRSEMGKEISKLNRLSYHKQDYNQAITQTTYHTQSNFMSHVNNNGHSTIKRFLRDSQKRNQCLHWAKHCPSSATNHAHQRTLSTTIGTSFESC